MLKCSNRGSKAKRHRVGLGVHCPQPEFVPRGDLSLKVFGVQTNNRADAMACPRVPEGYHGLIT